jgi:hypothetical protein
VHMVHTRRPQALRLRPPHALRPLSVSDLPMLVALLKSGLSQILKTQNSNTVLKAIDRSGNLHESHALP